MLYFLVLILSCFLVVDRSTAVDTRKFRWHCPLLSKAEMKDEVRL